VKCELLNKVAGIQGEKRGKSEGGGGEPQKPPGWFLAVVPCGNQRKKKEKRGGGEEKKGGNESSSNCDLVPAEDLPQKRMTVGLFCIKEGKGEGVCERKKKKKRD